MTKKQQSAAERAKASEFRTIAIYNDEEKTAVEFYSPHLERWLAI
jgi:hypothetical protein